ncbi:MAG TPA: phage portal protein [Anaerolineaceae bacterium]|nr:phage portal protein [Anaerolineaceae bacterium]
MGLLNNFRNWLLEPLLGSDWAKRSEVLNVAREYRRGKHKPPIKTPDDAIVINFIGLLTDRSIANLFGKEPIFDLPGESDSAEQVYIDGVWAANRKMNLLKQAAMYGAESGTCYIKILPNGAIDKTGAVVPRLVALDPSWVTMDTLPEDVDTVIRYTIAYTITDPITKKEKAIKQVIEHDADSSYWSVVDYVSTGSRWDKVDESMWEFDFAPIISWQNLPEPGSPYGRPDITEDLIDLQNKINFVSSNTAKTIKYHAHPKTWARGFLKQEKVSWGADEMVISDDPNALVQNLEMQSDLGSSMDFIRYLRQALFDVSRAVDIDSMADKIGSLTNFGLRVLYQDALGKLEEKRGLYGEAIIEINHRLLVLSGAANTDGGEIDWPDVMPENENEVSQAIRNDLELGLVSKQTASGRRGYTWADEEQRIADERLATDNIGAALLRQFGQGE